MDDAARVQIARIPYIVYAYFIGDAHLADRFAQNEHYRVSRIGPVVFLQQPIDLVNELPSTAWFVHEDRHESIEQSHSSDRLVA